MTTRRDFLKTSSLIGFGSTVPAFLGHTARSAPLADKAGAKDTVLVVVQLTGGNDGLNTVVPFTNADYYKLRPTIAIAKDQVKKLTDDVGFHPAMTTLAKLYTDDSAVCVVQGVGYPNPSQSHFRSMDVWHAASAAEALTTGWLGQSLKKRPVPAFHLAGGNEPAPLALTGAPVRVPSITSLDDFKLKTVSVTGADATAQKNVITSAATVAGGSSGTSLLDFVARTQMSTYASSEKLASIGKNYAPKVPYPTSALGNKLKLAAQLIDADIGARLFYVSIDGFDTHAGQGGTTGAHANLLTQASDAISAFYRDLAGRGHKDRLCVMTFSEFGRRAYENGSKGTDHGAGAPMILVGGGVKAGVVGEHPSLKGLKEGNLVHGTDFRRVYAAVLDKWLGIDPKPVLGDGFKPAEVFAK
ncbi:hypothetical protein VT84_03165 [Gemmata sp. SH-PL17]|uniref:DUF1501 domain-containing protein n=1 Tax=Gemmata sp. SH-PL17 TaxID=1630693 RepID=UPI0004B57EE9|nr:DUF1501 domain-containing protein [Gemmata sp. SH-PL17]AMV23382.1 hypothetical protein VT84_03165 [Gemmata sp. SH-PL17]